MEGRSHFPRWFALLSACLPLLLNSEIRICFCGPIPRKDAILREVVFRATHVGEQAVDRVAGGVLSTGMEALMGEISHLSRCNVYVLHLGTAKVPRRKIQKFEAIQPNQNGYWTQLRRVL
jgi:hypothetical protein